MSNTLHVFDFLSEPLSDVPAVCVLVGEESSFKQRVLKLLQYQLYGAEAEHVPISTWSGKEAEWRDVIDELVTSSLFAESRRFVVVRDADDFVKQHRTSLEDYVDSPSAASTLVLDVKSWPGNTRLAKRVAKSGWTIECRPPQRQAGKRAVVDRQRMTKWIKEWSASEYQLALERGKVTRSLNWWASPCP